MRCTTLFRTSLMALTLSTVLGGISQAGEVQNTLSLDGSYTRMNYKEMLNPPAKSTERGWLKGIGLTYTRQGADRWYFKLHGDVKGADVTYDGSTQFTFQPVKSTSGAFIWNVEGNLGYTFMPTKTPTIGITPYAGMGMRSWDRDLPGETTETYKWVYGKLGVRTDWFPTTRFRIGLDIAGQLPISAIENSMTLRDPSIQGEAKFKLGARPGFHFAVPMSYRINKSWSLMSSLSWERIYIGQSDTLFYRTSSGSLLSVHEPSSRTEMIAINVGVQYHF